MPSRLELEAAPRRPAGFSATLTVALVSRGKSIGEHRRVIHIRQGKATRAVDQHRPTREPDSGTQRVQPTGSRELRNRERSWRTARISRGRGFGLARVHTPEVGFNSQHEPTVL